MPNNVKRLHHITPQFYLEGFARREEPREIYVFEEKRTPRSIPIPVAGVQKDYYATTREDGTKDTQTVEDYLANKIEGPANGVIKSIRKRNMLTDNEKLILAQYVAAMMTRVPKHRERARKIAQTVAQDHKTEWENAINREINKDPSKAELLEARKAQVFEYIENFGNRPPSWLFTDAITTADKYAQKIYKMNWVFFTTSTRKGFITSDNPVFFFEGIGLVGKQDYEGLGEISFPIATDIALWASWQDIKEGFLPVSEKWVDEINNRTASSKHKYIYYCTSARWVRALAKRASNPTLLNRIILTSS